MGNKLPKPDGMPSGISSTINMGTNNSKHGGASPAASSPAATNKALAALKNNMPQVTGAGGVSPSTGTPKSRDDSDAGFDDGTGPMDVDSFEVDIQRRYSHVEGKAISIDDFDLLKVLGKGSFGKVMLVRFKASNDLFAMKTLRKEALIRRNQLAHTSTERFILQNIHHPFLMKLSFAFQTKDKLYMVVDYMAGGELFFWLKKGKFSENRAKLYAAEIACALEALHDHNIVYRDLKPENVLLDADGHIRITDFGLSKDNVTGYGAEGGTSTFCGTPEYLAPEVLENKGHGKGIDWWSLGTLLYEMICGLPPFYDQNVQKMYKKIMTAPLNLPKILSEDAKSIVRSLLERRVANRLGCGPAGALEIKKHPFFSCYSWDAVIRKEYRPEFIPPKKRRSLDVDNFDKEFTAEPAVDSVVQNHLTVQQEEMANFEGFTYDGDSRLS